MLILFVSELQYYLTKEVSVSASPIISFPTLLLQLLDENHCE